jgi:S1-C subfamily serine protease
LKLPANRKGIVILGIERGSRAQRYGFRPGDILTALSNRPIETMSALESALERSSSVWRVEIIRNGRRIRQVLR